MPKASEEQVKRQKHQPKGDAKKQHGQAGPAVVSIRKQTQIQCRVLALSCPQKQPHHKDHPQQDWQHHVDR
jgi:hypothetical protein